MDLKTAKMELKEKSRPYQTYSYYLTIPIFILIVFLLSFIGYNRGSLGIIIFVFVIFAHVWASKLELVRNRKHVAPILMYIAQAMGVVITILLVSEISSGGTGEISLGVASLIVLPIEIIAIVFFFISASDIKKAYPTMKQDAKAARAEYLALKRSK
ncbi:MULTISPECIES: hypothetical protein [Lactococcus]|uniref:Uncharacterized protein n=1 Tax=Lactococcus lactis subsp. cremoris TaxID=1359 RepID=A0A166JWV4_LACLC|nr:hypothetical protein [Lactococcus cremoris]KZK07004.1 hypothetical protein AB996_1033 [Lactococcus cremoris]